MIKTHVPSLPLCQRFSELCKEKGIEVPYTIYKWRDEGEHGYKLVNDYCDPNATIGTEDGERPVNDYPAPLVSELGEFLPKEMGGDQGGVQMLTWVNGKEWETSYYSFYNHATASQLENMPHMYTLADTSADSMMKMLNYLIEHGYVTNLKI